MHNLDALDQQGLLAPETEGDTTVPVEVPEDDGKVPCPGCGERFIKGPGLARHVATRHPHLRRDLPCECKYCRRRYKNQASLGKHIRTQHGRSVKDGSEMPERAAMEHVPARPARLSSDEITRAAALALWPRGIPHDKFSALLRWHQQTEAFLAEVGASP